MKTLELTCLECGHREICRPVQMLDRVQAIGMLRRTANPEPDFLKEIFRGSLPKLPCGSCGHLGLNATEFVEEKWDEDRLCEVCGKQIPAARLEALPTATCCVSCAVAD